MIKSQRMPSDPQYRFLISLRDNKFYDARIDVRRHCRENGWFETQCGPGGCRWKLTMEGHEAILRYEARRGK